MSTEPSAVPVVSNPQIVEGNSLVRTSFATGTYVGVPDMMYL